MAASDLHFESSSAEIKILAAAGTLPGVIPLFAAGLNGPGSGTLFSTGDGTSLAWQAPGSATPGTAVSCSADGVFLLIDGEDASKWIRVQVVFAKLFPGAASATVFLDDLFLSVAGGSDLSATQAAAGNAVSYTITLKNYGSTTITSLKAWIDAATPYLAVSADGTTYTSPTVEGSGITLANLAAGASLSLYLRRTVPATTTAAEILSLLHFSFYEGATKYKADCRGMYRIFNAAGFNLFRSNSAPPAITDTPFAFAATLPNTPASTFADGTWYLSVSAFNGLNNSGFMPLGPHGEEFLRLDIVSGNVHLSPPLGPTDWHLEAAAVGAIAIKAIMYDSSLLRAGEWAINYTLDGSTPASNAAAYSVPIDGSGLAVLDYALPFGVADGVTVKVRLQTRRNDGTLLSPVWTYSENSTVLAIVADAAGPAALQAAEKGEWIGEGS